MPEFDRALDFVHTALRQMRENASGPVPRASLGSVQQLADALCRREPGRVHAPTPASATATEATAVESRGRLGLAARALAAMKSSDAAPPQQPQQAVNPALPPLIQPPMPSAPPLKAVALSSPPRDASPDSPDQSSKAARMERLRTRASVCIKCPHLAATRTQVVFGVGNIDTELMFVGEAPGADEDLQGEPFVGKAGQLLTKIIESMGFERSDVYIGNVLKCRPDMPQGEPGNRKPRPEEMATCLPYLIEQIEIIQPKCLVALGATAMEGLLGATASMGSLRGRWHSFKDIPLMATYHPAYLVRNQSIAEKRKVWEDMLQVLERLGKPISQKQRNYFLSRS